MAQRSVIIKVGEPDRSDTWEDETKALIRDKRDAIIADVIALLKSDPQPLAKYSRWATWEGGVVRRLLEPQQIQHLILEPGRRRRRGRGRRAD